MNWFASYKYLVLPVVLVVALMLQPVTHGLDEALSNLVLLAVFLIVFESRRERLVGLVIALPGIALDIAAALCSGVSQQATAIAYHALVMLFLAFAVATILRNIFRSTMIRFDHLVGAFSGFVLAGICWGNLYLLIELVHPGSFTIGTDFAGGLGDRAMRRFLFNHLSFTVLAAAGNADIRPLLPFCCTLTWLEAMFGQFYVAVYIGQLIGLRLSSIKAS